MVLMGVFPKMCLHTGPVELDLHYQPSTAVSVCTDVCVVICKKFDTQKKGNIPPLPLPLPSVSRFLRSKQEEFTFISPFYGFCS